VRKSVREEGRKKGRTIHRKGGGIDGRGRGKERRMERERKRKGLEAGLGWQM
jgi:hypothetical protein